MNKINFKKLPVPQGITGLKNGKFVECDLAQQIGDSIISTNGLSFTNDEDFTVASSADASVEFKAVSESGAIILDSYNH